MVLGMADNESTEQPAGSPAAADASDETSVTAAVPGAAVDPAGPPPTQPAPGPRWRERVFSFRAVVAVGIATLILGGSGGAAVVALTNDGHDDRPRMSRFNDGPGRQGNDQRDQGRFGGGRGVAPPRVQQDGQQNVPENGTEQQDSQPEPGAES